MSKYIDLNEATDLFKGIDATMTGGWVADTLEALPTIDIIHCKECKYWRTDENVRCRLLPYADANDYCSYGERSEE